VFTNELTSVYSAYFELHTALANDDASDAREAIHKLHETLQSIDDAKLAAPADGTWKTVSDHLTKATSLASGESDIGKIRAAFETIADAMIELDYYFGHPDTIEHYVTFCPMAFDNRGAYWLQNQKTIANPYFGHEMPKCGKVTDQIDPDHEH